MTPLSFYMVFIPYGGQVSRTVRDGDIPDGAPERSGTLGGWGATALAPDWTPLRIEPSLQNVYICWFACLKIPLQLEFSRS
jgi:hypothetical protein